MPLTFYNYKLGTVRMWWVRMKHCTVAGKKSISAPEIGYLTRKDIVRYKRADMKYYFSKVYFVSSYCISSAEHRSGKSAKES